MSTQLPKVGVSGILYEDGKILLGKRSPDDEALPGLWNTPGGGLEWREPVNIGISREYVEEVGLRVGVEEGFLFVGDALYIPEKHNVLVFKQVFRLAADNAQPIAGDGISEVRWFTWDQIKWLGWQDKLTPMTKAALAEFDKWRHL